MGMSRAELEAALASVSKIIARLGDTAAQTTNTFEELAQYMADQARNTSGRITQAIEEKPLSEYYPKPKKEEKKDPMLNTEYTTVYDDLKTDWDESKTIYVNMSEVQNAAAQVKAAKPSPTPTRVRICMRNDITSNWLKHNPILHKGELAVEYSEDGSKCHLKCGDGIRAFKDLPYITTPESEDRVSYYAVGGRGNSIKIEI